MTAIGALKAVHWLRFWGLDDSCLKGLPYYPYDMVHWNDIK